MQDRYHFWVQMAQADQTSISAWETAVSTAAGRCSFRSNAHEFIRDKFLFGLNESFSRFREHIFYRDRQRKPENPPFTLAFVVSQAMSFEAAQQTNKLLARMKEMLYEVRCLKSNEDMILALAGQFKQLYNCLNCPASARIISSFETLSSFFY